MTQTAVYQAKPLEELISRVIDYVFRIEYTALLTGVCPYKLGSNLQQCPRYQPIQTSRTREYPKKHTVVLYTTNPKMEECNAIKTVEKTIFKERHEPEIKRFLGKYDPDEKYVHEDDFNRKVWENYQFFSDRWLKCNSFRESLVDEIKTLLGKDEVLQHKVQQQLSSQYNIGSEYSNILDVSIRAIARIISSLNPGQCTFLEEKKCHNDYESQMDEISQLSGFEKELNDPCNPEMTVLERYRDCKPFERLLFELIEENVIFWLKPNNSKNRH